MGPTCIKCLKELPVASFAKNMGRANGRQNRCRGCQKKMARKHYEANKGAYAARRKAQSPTMRRAQHAVEVALKNGTLARSRCQKCGSRAEAHHDDYAKKLDVTWLCRTHHQEWHRENGEGLNK